MYYEKAQELLKKGGNWLGTARSFIQNHCIRGDSVTWGSQDPLVDMTPRKLLEMAARCINCNQKNFIEATYTMLRDSNGAWAEPAKTWISENTGRDSWEESDTDQCFVPPLGVAQVEAFAAYVTAATLPKEV